MTSGWQLPAVAFFVLARLIIGPRNPIEFFLLLNASVVILLVAAGIIAYWFILYIVALYDVLGAG